VLGREQRDPAQVAAVVLVADGDRLGARDAGGEQHGGARAVAVDDGEAGGARGGDAEGVEVEGDVGEGRGALRGGEGAGEHVGDELPRGAEAEDDYRIVGGLFFVIVFFVFFLFLFGLVWFGYGLVRW